MKAAKAGSIDFRVNPQAIGHQCQITLTLDGQKQRTVNHHGQNANHAIAIALEELARDFRQAAETEQNLAPLAVERTASRQVKDQWFHVVVHYERVDNDESKFEAMHGTLMGNTVVENAEVTVVRVDPQLPIKPWRRNKSRVSAGGPVLRLSTNSGIEE